MQSLVQKEGKAHNEDTAKADKNVKTKPAEEGIPQKAERKAKAKKLEEKTSVFPADARINDYGFLGFRSAWLEDLGWSKGMPLKIEKSTDGSITLRKA